MTRKGFPNGGLVDGGNGASHQRHFSTSAKWRQKAGAILKRMHQNALGLKDEWGHDVVMRPDQIMSGAVVLKKIIPDLAVQTVIHEKREALDAAQILSRIQAIIAERPELLKLLTDKQADSVTQASPSSETLNRNESEQYDDSDQYEQFSGVVIDQLDSEANQTD